jgi:hypothetical protein
VFKKEEQLYRDEGIPFDKFVFIDNQVSERLAASASKM